MTSQLLPLFIRSGSSSVSRALTSSYQEVEGSIPWWGRHFFCSIDKENLTKICTYGNQLFNFHSTNQVIHFSSNFKWTLWKCMYAYLLEWYSKEQKPWNFLTEAWQKSLIQFFSSPKATYFFLKVMHLAYLFS